MPADAATPADPLPPVPQHNDLRASLRRKRRAFLNGLQRWQNLTSAMIALGAAIVAWQYTQRQIEVAQNQLSAAQEQVRAAQTQAAIARSDLLIRRLAEFEIILAKIRNLASDNPYHASYLRLDGKKKPDEETRRAEIDRLISDLGEALLRLPQTPAVVAAAELVSRLRFAARLDSFYRRLGGDDETRFYYASQLVKQREAVSEQFEPAERLLVQEIGELRKRLVELETSLR